MMANVNLKYSIPFFKLTENLSSVSSFIKRCCAKAQSRYMHIDETFTKIIEP